MNDSWLMNVCPLLIMTYIPPSLTPLDLLFIEEATCLDDHVPFCQPPGFQHRFLTNCCKNAWKNDADLCIKPLWDWRRSAGTMPSLWASEYAQTAEIVCKPQNSQHNFCTGYFSEHVVLLPFSNRPLGACTKKSSTTNSISSADISLPLNYPPWN